MEKTRRDFLKAAAAAGIATALGENAFGQQKSAGADLILRNGRFALLDGRGKFANSVAIANGAFRAVGDEKEILALRGPGTQVIDLRRRTVVPGLNDSHTHPIRGGLTYNLELRWDGVPSLVDAMRMLKDQARRTPPPQWVRVVGGFTHHQFAEKRLPTLKEINDAAPDTPVFILHLYDRALLNRAALRAVGYDKEVPSFPASEVDRDSHGNPTGLLIAKPNATILYTALGKGPKLNYDDQVNSTRHFMREMNRLGLTSVIDAGGGGHSFPDDYKVIEELNRQNLLTTRIAYNLFTQRPKQEKEDFANWVKVLKPGQGSDMYRHNGAGEMLVYSAADFEDFLVARPEMPPNMEKDLLEVATLLAENRWPFRLHATYDETIERALNVLEQVNKEAPLGELHWILDHAETISERNMERVKALGGGIAIQHRLAYQGEDFIKRYGKQAAGQSPPVRKMLAMGIPVGGGTDATRVASYNPFVCLYWLVSGKTLGGTQMYAQPDRLSREEALKIWTEGGAWFSREEGKKGKIAVGQFADLAVLSADYFSMPEEAIKGLESVLTIVGGKVVYGAKEFAPLAPPLPPASPDWSPVRKFGGYYRADSSTGPAAGSVAAMTSHLQYRSHDRASLSERWGLGCDCFAF